MLQPVLLIESILTALGQGDKALFAIQNSHEYQTILQSHTPDNVFASIRIVGDVLGMVEETEQIVESLEERTNIIKHKLKFITPEQKPTVLCLQDVSPASIWQNDYVDTLIDLAGGIPYGKVDKDTFSPDIVIIVSDTPVPTLFSDLPVLLDSSTWANTPAVEKNNIFIIQDINILRQPSLRVADEAELLAEIISSKYFIYGNNGTAWIRFELT